ncbi:MAG: hypothetical protein NZM25_00395 [Leptospiraceae bacterium]|nr:hypothetical protein [Leptospiraceae bacterium]MDW8306183.1 hypothetical protein [Leptospiraceae bacterium]
MPWKILTRLFFFFSCVSSTLHAAINYYFPALASSFLSGAEEYGKTYEAYSRAFCVHYGRAMAFTNHLSYPVGKDSLGVFPSVYVGLGMGTAFSNTLAMKAATNENLSSGFIPKVLPTAGLSLNVGIGLTRKWHFRIGFLPIVQMALPQQLSDIDLSLRYGNAKARLSYTWLESAFLRPGLSVAGYLAYTEGKVRFAKDNIASVNHSYNFFDGFTNHSATVNFQYQVATEALWRYLGAGAEIRIWYDLWLLVPYVGLGLGAQGGRFSTSLDIQGDIAVSIPSLNPAPQLDTGYMKITEKARADSIISRFFLGLEINAFVAKTAVELQFDNIHRLAGIALGASVTF